MVCLVPTQEAYYEFPRYVLMRQQSNRRQQIIEQNYKVNLDRVDDWESWQAVSHELA